MLSIFIDADACPVREETYKVARRHNVSVTVVSNSFLRIPREPLVKFVCVPDNFDAADDYIAELLHRIQLALNWPCARLW